jgi:ABC-2 type transport system permease protein
VSSTGVLARQVRYTNLAFWRNPASAFFTFAFPLMFLVIFNLLFGNNTTNVGGHQVSGSTFYVPAIAAFSVITACYTNIAITVSFMRDEGILKRKRGTPLPIWAFLLGRIVHATLMAILLVAIVAAAGVLFYNVSLPGHTMAAFIVTLAIGAAAFCSLGLAIANFVPNAEAAPAVVNAIILPLLFISDVFIPLPPNPKWLITFSNLFPVKHYSVAMQTAFSPFTTGSGFKWHDLAIVGVWGLAALIIAIRFFSPEPRK